MKKSPSSLQALELATLLPVSCALTAKEEGQVKGPSLLPTKAEALFTFVTERAVDLRVDLEEALNQVKQLEGVSLNSDERYRRMLSLMGLGLLSQRLTALTQLLEKQQGSSGRTLLKSPKEGCTCRPSPDLVSAPGSFFAP